MNLSVDSLLQVVRVPTDITMNDNIQHAKNINQKAIARIVLGAAGSDPT